MGSRVVFIMSVYHSDDFEHFVLSMESMLNQTVPCDIYLYRDGPIGYKLQNKLDYYARNARCKVFTSQKNEGLACALNFLIERALEGKYDLIARMDSDDISHPERIARQVKYMEMNGEVDVLGTSCKEFGSDFAFEIKSLPNEHKDIINFSISRCPFVHPTVMFRKRVFIDGYRYPLNVKFTEDMALWFELLRNGYIFSNLNEVLLDYRLSEETLERRRGFDKVKSEVKLRYFYMKSLKKVSVSNLMLIGSRFVLHLAPPSLMKVLYQRVR